MGIDAQRGDIALPQRHGRGLCRNGRHREARKRSAVHDATLRQLAREDPVQSRVKVIG
jgi:hypothetical protein